MVDSFLREVNYLRISITDRCNLNCVYCKPENSKHYDKSEILSYEEILRLCAIFASLGVQNFRITGGEPLMRRGCIPFVNKLKALGSVGLTTNATLLRPHIHELKDIAVNISLNSFENNEVLKAAEEAASAGIKTKTNTVLLKGINDHQIIPIASIAEKLPIHVRFIELMPTAANEGLIGVPSAQILEIIKSKYEDLAPNGETYGNGPAIYYKSNSLLGSIGLISPLGKNFCHSCNRLRLSSTGFLRLCLHHNQGLDLRPLLRLGASDADIKQTIVSCLTEKPRQHFLENQTIVKDMSKIGG